MFWIMMLAFVGLMTAVMLLYLSPGDKPKEVKRKEKEKDKERKLQLMADPLTPVAPQKDWKGIAERWEKNIAQLSAQIEQYKAKEREHAKQVHNLETQKKEFMDKLELEKSWREKEQVTLEKFKHHEKDFKEQIFRTEGDLEKEHAMRLRVERELQEARIKLDATIEEKRQLAVKSASLETTLSAVQKQVKELSQENNILKEKREDVQWVAKTQYEQLNQRFIQVSNELKQLKDKTPQ